MPVEIKTHPTRLRFRFPFRIAHGERTHTDSVIVRILSDGLYGLGEATLPPYLPDTIDSVTHFLNHPFFQSIPNDFQPEEVFAEMDELAAGNMPAKAAIDMALWDLKAKQKGISLTKLLAVNSDKEIPHSYTLSICDFEEMKESLQFGLDNGFRFFKLKLDGNRDEEIIRNYRSLCSHPFAVDANQSWRIEDKTAIQSRLSLLEEYACVLIEQPFEKSDREHTLWLQNQTNIPIIADESCQRIEDIEELRHCFDGINIKLQKCGGLTEAKRMIALARDYEMKVLIGCMSESHIGCDAAEALAPLCDWADLDGPYLIIE